MIRARIHIALGLLGAAILTNAQTPTVRPIGAVKTIDAAQKTIILGADSGSELGVTTEQKTRFLRIAPGEKDLKTATTIAFSDIATGDRILVRGAMDPGQKSITASSIVVMTQADLAKKHAADRAEWDKRGVTGTITAIDAGAHEITISSRPQPLIVTLAPKAELRRYAPDSVKFSDAKPSAFEDMKAGDQIRALGSKNEQGKYVAEELVSGSFRTVAATVSAIDAAESTVRITDLATKKPLIVKVTPDSTLRTLPPMMAQMIAGRREAAAAGPPAGARGGPDVQRMLDRMPAFTLGDLKPGDAILVASTQGSDTAKLTAITILSGVEPILQASPRGSQQVLGAWNLDINMGMQ